MWYKYLLEEIQKTISSGYTGVFSKQNCELTEVGNVFNFINLKPSNFDVSISSKSMCLIIIGDTQGDHQLFANIYIAYCWGRMTDSIMKWKQRFGKCEGNGEINMSWES